MHKLLPISQGYHAYSAAEFPEEISGALLFVLMGCNGTQQTATEMPWFEGQFAEAQNVSATEDLMIFFETEW